MTILLYLLGAWVLVTWVIPMLELFASPPKRPAEQKPFTKLDWVVFCTSAVIAILSFGSLAWR